jgi:hypothetical protein
LGARWRSLCSSPNIQGGPIRQSSCRYGRCEPAALPPLSAATGDPCWSSLARWIAASATTELAQRSVGSSARGGDGDLVPRCPSCTQRGQAPGEVDKALGAATSALGTETRRQRPGHCLQPPPSRIAVPRLEDRVPGQRFRGPLSRLSVPKLDDRDLDQALAAAIAGLGTGTR